jgi:probable F420-dependent oxidoreductase
MRFSYAESMCDPTFYLPLAKAAEAAGFTTFLVPDSVLYPEASDTRYPYTPTGDRRFLEDKPFIEPFSLIPALGAVTEKLRFATFVLKLPIRSPVLVAKSVSSVAVLTGDRFSLGVGTSPWPEDFAACAQDWTTRGRRMDDMIAIIRGLLGGGFFEFHSADYDLAPIKMCPVPSRPVPILIGGHAEAALKRAARIGDGWMHAGGDPAELATYVERVKALRREYGRENVPFEVHASSLDAYSVEGVQRLRAMGVTDVVVGFRNPYTKRQDTQPLAEKIELMQQYAENVIRNV